MKCRKVLFAILSIFSVQVAKAEQTKTVFNPFTGKFDFITAITTNTIKAGTGVTTTCTSGACTIAATSGGGGSTNGTVLPSTATNLGVYSDTTTISGLAAGTTTQVLMSRGSALNPYWTNNLPSGSSNYVAITSTGNFIQNTSSLQSGATFYVSSGTVNTLKSTTGSIGTLTSTTGNFSTLNMTPAGAQLNLGPSGFLNFSNADNTQTTSVFDGGTSSLSDLIFTCGGPGSCTLDLTGEVVRVSGNGLSGLASQPLGTDVNGQIMSYGGITAQLASNEAFTGVQTFTASSTTVNGNLVVGGSETVKGASGMGVTYNINVGSMTGAGLSNCGSTSQAVSWVSATSLYGCTTITAAGIGALTGNQSITISGDSSGSGTTAITNTNAALQSNITTFGASSITVNGNLIIGGSDTVRGANGSAVTYGAILGSATVNDLTASQYVKTDTVKKLVSQSGVPATDLTGTIADARLSSNVPLLNSTNVWTGGNTFQSSTTANGKLVVISTMNIGPLGAELEANELNSPVNISDNQNAAWGMNMRNKSTGNAAAGFYSVTSALGGYTSYYITMGIVSPTFNQFGFGTVTSTMGFIYTTDSNLEMAAGLNGTQGDIIFGTGLPTVANRRMSISSTGTITTLGNLQISSGLITSNGAGTNGQALTSGGPGTIPTWATPSGSGDVVTTATQTLSGINTFQGAVVFSSGVRVSTDGITANYTVTSTDTLMGANCASPCTFTLPTAVGISGRPYTLAMLGTAQVTLATTSSQTIGTPGATTQVLYIQGSSIDVWSDGSNWQIK